MNDLSLCAVDSLEGVADRYGNMIYRLAYAKTKNIHDAEDVLQEVFLRYAKTGAEGKIFDSEEHRKAWLLRVTVNCSKNVISSGWHRRRNTNELEEGRLPDAASEYEISDTRSAVLNAVNSLSEKYRIAVYLFYYEELSIEEISDITGVSVSSVKTRLHRARQQLKGILKEVDFNG